VKALSGRLLFALLLAILVLTGEGHYEMNRYDVDVFSAILALIGEGLYETNRYDIDVFSAVFALTGEGYDLGSGGDKPRREGLRGCKQTLGELIERHPLDGANLLGVGLKDRGLLCLEQEHVVVLVFAQLPEVGAVDEVEHLGRASLQHQPELLFGTSHHGVLQLLACAGVGTYCVGPKASGMVFAIGATVDEHASVRDDEEGEGAMKSTLDVGLKFSRASDCVVVHVDKNELVFHITGFLPRVVWVHSILWRNIFAAGERASVSYLG
jgi:hypothetical protein